MSKRENLLWLLVGQPGWRWKEGWAQPTAGKAALNLLREGRSEIFELFSSCLGLGMGLTHPGDLRAFLQ